jgi:purine-nucleoside/S-methyl-5'-thioadenosine phosphorylase / adenosine deaminase
MIRPPGANGVVFTEAGDGDILNDPSARHAISNRLGISPDWATAHQVHRADAIHVESAREWGSADAMWTGVRDLPLAVFTADCLGVVLVADDAVGVAHAGWRGIDARVVGAVREAMAAAGHVLSRAMIGPGIGACCFEVGPEVTTRFQGSVAQTSWGSESVDLVAALEGQLEGLEIWSAGACTRHDDRFFSHRRNGTRSRLAAIGWLP